MSKVKKCMDGMQEGLSKPTTEESQIDGMPIIVIRWDALPDGKNQARIGICGAPLELVIVNGYVNPIFHLEDYEGAREELGRALREYWRNPTIPSQWRKIP